MTKTLIDDAVINDVAEERLRVILEEGAKTPMNFEWVKPELPPYYNERMFRLGQQAFYNNFCSMMIAKLSGLVSILSIKSILDVLICTKQSGIPCLAYRRYAMTVLHTLVWLEKDPKKSKEFLESIKIVRKKHCVAFKKAIEAGLQQPTQLDMSLAQFGFIGYVMISSEFLGIKTTREEMEGLVHVWRVIGNMLGMEEKFNLCSGSVAETNVLCQKMLDCVILPAMMKKNKDFDLMSRIMLDSLWVFNFVVDSNVFTTFTYYLIAQSTSNHNHSIIIDTTNMPFVSWLTFITQCFVVKYIMQSTAWWSLFPRTIINKLTRFSAFLMDKYPIFASWKYGEKFAKIDIFRYRIE